MAAAAYCTSCGSPATRGAGVCAFCGAALPTPASLAADPARPLESTPVPADPPIPSSASYGTPVRRPTPGRSRRTVVAVIGVAVILLFAGLVVAFAFTVPTPPQVEVHEIDVWAPDNVCGMNASLVDFDGYNATTSENVTLEFGMPNFNSTGCTIHSAATNTSGFALFGVQAPLDIPANGTAWMNITIESPGSEFNGNLFLVLA